MNIKQQLTRKRIVVPTVAAVALLGAGGVAWAGAADDVRGGDRDRAGEAALAEVGGGTVTDVEREDDGQRGYEVEVTRPDGTEADVRLDDDFTVIGTDRDDEQDDGDDRERDDRVLGAQERAAAERAALAEVAGTVTDVEASDDRGEAYEVEIVTNDGQEWTVELDADYGVVGSHQDD